VPRGPRLACRSGAACRRKESRMRRRTACPAT
jgi:hypothetical protein